MADRNTEIRPHPNGEEWLDQAPKLADALKRGVTVSLTTWGGTTMLGTVCDRDTTGILLDPRGADSSPDGFVFLPWSSVEQVNILEVSHRRVKFLQG